MVEILARDGHTAANKKKSELIEEFIDYFESIKE